MRKADRSGDVAALRLELAGLESNEIADRMRRLDPIDQAVDFRSLKKRTATQVFEDLGSKRQRALLDSLGADEVTEIFAGLAVDDRARLLDEMPATVAARFT